MPQVVSDPSLSPGIVSNGGTDLFAYPDTPVPSVLDFQAVAAQPLPPGTATATGMISPDLHLPLRVRNFPPEVYDLSASSVLTHFLQAILGDSGTGQVRRRQLLARLQQSLASTRFYDLDAFYGALFGVQRGPNGTLPTSHATGLPVDPYTELATSDGWDEIEAIDARFRERVIALARAITLGGTPAGLRALAEAITGVECHVYEAWRLGAGGVPPPIVTFTWAHVMGQHATWATFTSPTITWQALQGTIAYSGSGISNPAEVIIQPRNHYGATVAAQRQRAADMFGILSVTDVLKPAFTTVTVDLFGAQAVIPSPLTGAWADSDYWEVTHLVTPPARTAPAYVPASNAYGQPPGPVIFHAHPPITRRMGGQFSHTGTVTKVQARAYKPKKGGPGTGPPPIPFHSSPNPGGPGHITSGQNWETQANPGGPASYPPAAAVMTPKRAASARTASAASMHSAPYSGPRVPKKAAS